MFLEKLGIFDMKAREWVGTREAAELLQVSQRTIQNWIDDGKIASNKTMGGHRRIRRTDLLELLEPEDQQTVAFDKLRPLQVLLVEDDPVMAELCVLRFQTFSTPYQLHLAKNGYEGLMLIGSQKPDLLLTDLKMPGIDGFEMIRELEASKMLENLRIVVITGMEPEAISRRGGLPESVTVLNKPIPFTVLETLFAQRATTLGLLNSDMRTAK